MIKKVLLLVLVIIFAYGSYTSFAQGFFGIVTSKFQLKLDVTSYAELKDNKQSMDNHLKELNNLNTTKLNEAVDNVRIEKTNYEAKKNEYDTLALSASEADIAEANKIERYLLDYLWIRVGNYANDNAVKFKMTPDEATSTLSFDITGSYVSVINFIYDIQNDTELNFKVDGIVVEGGSSDSIVKANFVVKDVNVITSPEE